jgi:hypothetical protein
MGPINGTTTKSTMPLYATPRGVQKMYTEAQVFAIIKAKHEAKISLRDIAGQYENITHADIARILQGEFPHSPCKRMALGMAPLALTEVCPVHGVVHKRKTCPGERSQAQRWVRVAGHAGGRWM